MISETNTDPLSPAPADCTRSSLHAILNSSGFQQDLLYYPRTPPLVTQVLDDAHCRAYRPEIVGLSEILATTQNDASKETAKKSRNRRRKKKGPATTFQVWAPSDSLCNLPVHDTDCVSYLSLLRRMRGSVVGLPPGQPSRTPLIAFPGQYRSPQEVPQAIQCTLSSYRFFFANRLLYCTNLGQCLYIGSRTSFENGAVRDIFPEQTGRTRELFHRNTVTGTFYYLGLFRLVQYTPFAYSRREVGHLPDIWDAPVNPARGNGVTPYMFVVLQFVAWNDVLFRALSTPAAQVLEA